MSRRVILAGFVLLLAVVVGSLFWRSRQTSLRTRTFEFHYLTRIPTVPAEAGKLRLWIPVPESDAHQEISSLAIESPAPNTLHCDSEYRNLYAYLELEPTAQRTPLEVRLRFQVRRHEHQVSLNASAVQATVNEDKQLELARFLQLDRLVPVDRMIAALAEPINRPCPVAAGEAIVPEG